MSRPRFSTPSKTGDLSDTARCLEESFLHFYGFCFITSRVFNSNNVNNFSTTVHHLVGRVAQLV